jgi:hypothetical protein
MSLMGKTLKEIENQQLDLRLICSCNGHMQLKIA